MNEFTVLRAASCSETTDYRKAVSQIIRDIQRDLDKELCDIAEDIDVSRGTISNALHCRGDLSAIYLKRLGKRYGAAYLNPYLALFGAQAAPIKSKPEKDILPIVTKVAHKVAAARDPEGPGGAAEVPQEKLGYLSDLKTLLHAAGCLVSHIEETV